MPRVLAVFVLLFAVYAVTRMVRDRLRAPRLERAAGTVLERRFAGRTTTSQAAGQGLYVVSVRFTTAAGEEVASRAMGQYRDQQVAGPGERVDVWYDRTRPQYFQLIPAGSLRSAWPFLTIFSAIGAVAVAILV
jgi:hypothetical protein